MQTLLPDQRRSYQERNTVFLMLLIGVFVIQMWGMSNNQKRREELARRQAQEQKEILDKPVVSPTEKPEAETESGKTVEATDAAPQWVTLGSMDPESPYRMLVTLTNQGAAVVRAELNTNQYRDVQEPSGYLGQIVVDEKAAEEEAAKHGGGVMVQVVGSGTPAHQFELKPGDRIVRIDRKLKNSEAFETAVVKNFADLRSNLQKTRPGDRIVLTVNRPGHEGELEIGIILRQQPMNVIRPEVLPKSYEEYRQLGGLHGAVLPKRMFDRLNEAIQSGELSGLVEARKFDEIVGGQSRSNQLSFLTTLWKVDGNETNLPVSMGRNNSKQQGIVARDASIDVELEGVTLRQEPWELVSSTENEAVFRRTVPRWNLEMVKTYRLARIETPEGQTPSVGAGYQMTMKVEVRNLGTKEHTVAYQLDGPTGLPLEGGWYSRKTGPGWGGYGIRDVVVRFQGNAAQTIANTAISCDKIDKPWIDDPLEYIGVDSLYFQCTLKPEKPEGEASWHVRSLPLRVGERNADWPVLTDVSYRLLSREKTLRPGDGLEHEYSIFLGPKDTRVLAEYELDGTISYGWFWFAAMPLLGVLHFFHGLGMTYAMAIIALTVCVRLLMFPISLKQAAGAAKMQVIQPALKEINEKYKDDMQARSAATSALFKKHNYNPMSGCLPLFIQLPIFIGLYKTLSIDAGLYGTSLISPAVRWCNDLSAPDMLFDWSSFWVSVGWPAFNTGTSPGFFGILCLGPYFNLLPMLTIALFLIQQAVMMPPPTDEQSRMQRKMMQYMMIFMGFMFFKIPSGLCIYFIISTLWGLAERRFVPKPAPPDAAGQTYDVTPVDPKEKHYKDKPKDRKKDKEPEKEEGFFARLMREVNEKAAEQRKLEKVNKKEDRKKKRK